MIAKWGYELNGDSEFALWVEERFHRSYDIDPETGCWLWRYRPPSQRYASVKLGVIDGISRHTLAHRWAYAQFVGPIPEKFEIHHTCEVTHCVNPQHLVAMTGSQNNALSSSPTAINSRKTHCPQGHPLSGSNLYIWPRTGYRGCRTCRREQ